MYFLETKKIIPRIVLLYLFSLSTMAAQNNLIQETIPINTSTQEILFSYGRLNSLKLDQTYSRLAKHGSNPLFNLGYQNTSSTKIIGVQSVFSIGSLKTSGNNSNLISNYAANLKLKYLKEVAFGKLSFYAGGNISFSGDVWFPKGTELRYGWDMYSGGGLAMSFIRGLNKRLFFQY